MGTHRVAEIWYTCGSMNHINFWQLIVVLWFTKYWQKIIKVPIPSQLYSEPAYVGELLP